MAGTLATRGLQRGDVVAVQLPNWRETAVAYMALATLGVVFVPIVHTHESFVTEVRDIYGPPVCDKSMVALHPFPAGHIAGLIMLFNPIVAGLRNVLLDRWDPEAAADQIEAHQITLVNGTPFHVGALLEMHEAGDPRFATVVDATCGAAGVPPSLVERSEKLGWTMRRTYGSSEHPTISIGLRSTPLSERARTDGHVYEGTRLRIVDDAGRDLGPDEEGEIWSIGPDQFVGYTDPALNAAAFAPGGWFRTGDVGVLNKEGNLTITDRIKDIIIRGGENLSSLEIEDLVRCHPSVEEAAAVGMPDPRYGERVCIFVKPVANRRVPDVDELAQHFAQLGVAKHKTPERVISVEELPRTASGKVKEPELRKRVGVLSGPLTLR